MTIVSDRISWSFNGSGTTQTVVLDISKVFEWVWNAGLIHKLKSYIIQIFGPIRSFQHNRKLWVAFGGKSSQENLVNAGAPQLHSWSDTFPTIPSRRCYL